MTLNDFQEHIAQYRLSTADQAYATLGLIGEIGELYGHFAKCICDGTDMNVEYIKKELGDVLWFVGALSHDLGSSLEEIAKLNVEKISNRAAQGTIQGSGDAR